MISNPELNTASQLLEELSDLLRQELALHESLRNELVGERDNDGKVDGPNLLRLQQKKYHLVSRIETLEDRRISKVRELANIWAEPVESLTLKAIIGRVPESPAQTLSACHSGLLRLIEEIRVLARETGANAQSRLKAVEATLSIVGEAARMHPTYSGSGKIQQRRPTFKNTSA
ncbi:MAG: flagellar protein FlgN [Deltaproteobacteria bacterium]|nr:flagellar protein FlgN [Deltaproteobacteria bacterium]